MALVHTTKFIVVVFMIIVLKFHHANNLKKKIIEIFSNDDDDGSENFAKKRNLRFFTLNRVYLYPVNMPNEGNFSWS